MKRLLTLLVLGCVAGAPATRPVLNLPDAEAALERAKAGVDETRAAVLKASREYQAAAADLAAKEKTLQEARRSGSPEEKLQASSAYTKARQRLDQVRAATNSHPRVLEAVRAVDRADATLKAARLQAEGDRLEAQKLAATRQAAAAEAAIPVVSAKELETVGERFDKKTVKMPGCTFVEVDNFWVNAMPGVTVSANGLVSMIDRREHEKWIGLNVRDSKGDFYNYAFASKQAYADMLLKLKEGQPLNLRGVVIELDGINERGLVCTHIEVVPVAPKGQRGAQREQDGPD
jgi:hypothetical protein